MALSSSINLALCVLALATTVQVSVGRPSLSANLPCNEAADIIFLVDTSSSIWPPHFNDNVKKFLRDVIGSFKIGPGPLDTRVGVTLFGTREYLDFHLNKYQTAKDILQAVDDMRFRGGDTYTHRALEFVTKEMLTPEHGSREGVAKLVVVLTDGKSINEKKTLAAAKLIKDTGASIFAIGVGTGVDFDELHSMASKPSTQFVFKVTDFRALDKMKKNFQRSTCEVLSTTVNPTSTTTSTTASSTTASSTTTTTTPRTTTTTTTMPTTTSTTTTPPPPPTTQSTTTTTTEPTTTTTEDPFLGDDTFDERCRGKPADIYFLLDSSSSVWIGHFHDRVLPFVRDLVSSFEISPLHTRVGLVTFSNEVNHEFSLSSHTDLESLHKAIQPENVEYLTGGTNTGDAIEYVTKRGFSAGEARKGVAQIIITVTDGMSQLPKKTAQAAMEARKQGVYMFAVGVGKFVDEQELADISSNPDEDFVFSVDDFKALTSITKLLALKTCKAVTKDDSNWPLDQMKCPKTPSNVMFLYEYLNSPSSFKIVVEDFISQITHSISAVAQHIKIGMLTQPCVGGVTSLQSVSKFQTALSQVRSSYYVGFPDLVKQLRLEVFSTVALTEQRIAVLILDETTRDLDLLETEVRRLKFQNVKVIVVAIGNVEEATLQRLASTPTKNHVIKIDGYSQIKNSKLDILSILCGKDGGDTTVNKPVLIPSIKHDKTEKPVLATTVVNVESTTSTREADWPSSETDSEDAKGGEISGNGSTSTEPMMYTEPEDPLDFYYDVIPN